MEGRFITKNVWQDEHGYFAWSWGSLEDQVDYVDPGSNEHKVCQELSEEITRVKGQRDRYMLCSTRLLDGLKDASKEAGEKSGLLAILNELAKEHPLLPFCQVMETFNDVLKEAEEKE